MAPRVLGVAALPLLLGAAALSWRFEAAFGERGRGRGELKEPVDAAVASDGTVVALDLHQEAVVVFSRTGRWIRTIGDRDDSATVEFRRPAALTVDDDDRVWVVDRGNHRLVVLSLEGIVLTTIGSLGSGELRFRYPSDLAFDDLGRVYVADSGNDRIQVLTAKGDFLAFWDSRTGGRRGHLKTPEAVAFSRYGDGGIWVLNRGWDTLERFDLDGEWEESRVLPPVAGPVELVSLAVEPGFYRMYLSDVSGRRILVLDRRGASQAEIRAPSGSAMVPFGLAVTDKSEVYVADGEGQRVLKYSR